MEGKIEEYAELADRELISRIVAGDEGGACYLIVERCGAGLKYLVRVRYASLHIEFDEAVSDVFVHLQQSDWRALRGFRGESQAGRSCGLKHYVLCIAARMFQKKLGNRLKEMAWIKPLENMEDSIPARDVAVLSRRAASVMEAIMALENPVDRQALLMYKIEERPVEEVARLLHTSPGAVYTRCSRALERLKRLLSE